MSIEKYQHGGGANFGWMDETPTPRTDAARFEALRDSAFRMDCIPLKLGQELERELAASKAEVERLRDALKSCFWATNTYDGNYARACDHVATIVTNALKTQDDK
jgi:prepilin-type processing-associated H-X9-DG protein